MGVVGKRKREKRTGHVQKSPVMVEQALSLPCFQLVVLRPAPCRVSHSLLTLSLPQTA